MQSKTHGRIARVDYLEQKARDFAPVHTERRVANKVITMSGDAS